MKKQLLLAGLVGIFLSAAAGEGGARRTVPMSHPVSTPIKKPQFRAVPTENSASRADRSLSKVAVASSGNAYGVVRSTSNCLDADDSLGTGAVTFLFRTDDSVYHNSNSSRYRFVLSTDGGSTFTSPSKELNRTVVYADNGINTRYPQGLLYRPTGVTDTNSSYVVYSGTWHNGVAGIWSGESRGVGKLSNDSTTFTEHDPNINTELSLNVLISSSLTKGGNKFYNATEIAHSTNYTTDGVINGFVFMTGLWNSSTNDVDWTNVAKPVAFDTYPTSATTSLYGGQAIAFDPTGQFGYWVISGDINPGDGLAEMKPVFSKTTDGGATWSDFQVIALDSISSFQRPAMVVDPNNGDSVASTINMLGAFDLVVDYLGNPHIGIIAELSVNYDLNSPIAAYGTQLFDLTPGSNLCNNGWIANYIKPVYALSAQYTNTTSTTGALTDNYRLQASRSQDGKHVFFLWNETDSTIAAQSSSSSYNNNSPNLLGVGIDVINAKTTAIKNFTAGDAMFGGQTPSFAGGSAGGSLFSLVSQTALSTASGFTVPATVTQLDYLNPTATTKNGDKPAKHWYLQNVTFANAEFTFQNADHDPPVFSHVADTVIVHLDSSITSVLPTNVTAFDCHDGDVTGNIHVNTSGVNTGVIGVYTVTYSVSDSAGNVGTASTTVLVEAKPIAVIGSVQLAGNKYTFIDSSLNLPTSRVWRFSNNSPSSTASQITKTFSVAGDITVYLKVSNYFGTDSTSKDFGVVLGIQNVEMDNSISVFPTTNSGQVTVAVNRTIDEDMTVIAYNMAGAVVSTDNTIKRNTSSTTLFFPNLSNGVYQLKIGNEKDGYAVKPIVIQK